MSELTPCNYCTLAAIRRRARKEGKKVVLKASKFMGGTDVFVMPENFNLPDYKEPSEKLPNGCEVYQKYHVSWLMSVPEHCCC